MAATSRLIGHVIDAAARIAPASPSGHSRLLDPMEYAGQMPHDVPAGFGLIVPMDEVIGGFAPVFLRRLPDGQVSLGFRVGRQHCNPTRHCHGGTWSTMADVLMGLNLGFVTGLTGPTVSMAIDFLGAAGIGQWVEGTSRVLRQTQRLGFVDCMFTADEKPALRASAVYRRKLPPVHDFAALVGAGHGNALPG